MRAATLGVAASGRFTPDGWIDRDPAVEKWFETCHNPQKALVQGVRQAPTSCLEGTSRRSVRGAEHQARLASVPHRRHPGPTPTGLLEGDGEISRVARFRDEPDLAAKTEALRGLIAVWIELKG